MSRKIKIYQVAALIDVTPNTIEMWYRWKKLNPDHELTNLLPDYEQSGAKGTRYWDMDDIYKLLQFKTLIPHGRNGILGEVTQKYCKKENNDNE